MPLELPAETELLPPQRDTVQGVESDEPPTIVSISDIHGYLESARSALCTLNDHHTYEPVVVPDEDGKLHWADENYVLVFNGDLIDRGPANDDVLALVARLVAEAPVGRVRVTLGNHEAIVLSPAHFGFDHWYSGQIDTENRQTFLETILDGYVVAAYEGYNVTYAHAGLPEPYDVTTLNESLQTAATTLQNAAGTIEDATVQQRVLSEHPRVLGTGNGHLKGAGAGIVWLDFSHLPGDAPPQVVGHTRHDEPRQKGNVWCQNVIRNNRKNEGGEAVFLETPQNLIALSRQTTGGVKRIELADFENPD